MTAPYPDGATVSTGTVGRAIFQSSDWKKIQKGKEYVPLGIFLNNKSLTEISVFILDIGPDDNLTEIGNTMATQRAENRKFYGWAEISVINASEENRKVCYTPRPENKWHADIILPEPAAQEKKERERHAIQLAGMAFPRASTNPH